MAEKICNGETCDVPDYLKCPEISPDKLYICSLQKKHKGDHCACTDDGTHNLKTWPKE